jgi:hypothetical protein
MWMKICVGHHHEQAKGWKREHKLQLATWNSNLENLNAHVVHEIGEMSSATIMEISDSE